MHLAGRFRHTADAEMDNFVVWGVLKVAVIGNGEESPTTPYDSAEVNRELRPCYDTEAGLLGCALKPTWSWSPHRLCSWHLFPTYLATAIL